MCSSNNHIIIIEGAVSIDGVIMAVAASKSSELNGGHLPSKVIPIDGKTYADTTQEGVSSVGASHKKEDLAATEDPKEKLCSRLGANLHKLPLEWICLSFVLLIVWGLLVLPIIYFHTDIVSLLCLFSFRLQRIQL